MQAQTFNISLPRDLVYRADLVAKREYRNRSELIKEALRSYLQTRENLGRIFEAGARAAKKLGIKNEDGVYKIMEEYRHGVRSS